jgi:hypothetical protein
MSSVNIEVSVSELQKLRQSLHDSLLLIDSMIQGKNVESAHPPKKVPKPTEMGICMFVNKKTLQQKSIQTREQVESCPERCSSKAFSVKNGVLVCKRHEKSDTSKLEMILSGIQPEFTMVPVEEEVHSQESPLEEGDYFSSRMERSPLERDMDQCEDIDKLLENTERVLPCRLGIRDICLVVYQGVYYAIDPLGECLGKITDESRTQEINHKMKTKEYFDIEGKLESLFTRDRGFLETFRLTYSKRCIQEVQ